MSHENEPKPQKLKLSRDSKPSESDAAAPPVRPPDQAKAQPPKPKLKISQQSTSDMNKPKEPEDMQEPATAQAAPPQLPPNLPKPTPQEQPVEDSFNQDELKQPKDNLLVSIFIICLLFAILSAAGIGIWWVLKPTADSEQAIIETAAEQSPEEAELSKPNYTQQIQRAKNTIASVPTTEIPDISGAETPTLSTPPLPENPPVNEDIQIVAKEITAAPTGANNGLQEAVTRFLTNVHIDGVRSGAKPKVMIQAESYRVGDEVDEATGLTFEGIEGGKLVFKDRNGVQYVKSF